MKFSIIDYVIVITYLLGTVLAGFFTARKQKNSKDYFLGGKKMKWWAVGFSIVASETSTLTFISIPGLAYKSDFTFMQLIIGYFVGRLLVTVIFIPAYYKGDIVTAYDFLGKRFGQKLRKLTSSVFIVTRVLASGVRLFATAIPVHIITGMDYPSSIAIIGVFTLLYTYLGGIKAVVTMDVIQMFIYVGGAVAAMLVAIYALPNGLSDVFYYASVNGLDKLKIFNFNFGNNLIEFFASPYTIIGGLLGGTFLTMASHGTDQLLVQRLLGCKTKKESQKALMLDASLIVVQFAFFMFLGLCLFAYYKGAAFSSLILSNTGLNLLSSDEIFPKFIVENLPSGISGLVIAGILASAMGTLSSAISSLASSTYLDLFASVKSERFRAKEMFWSKIFTLFWGVVLIGGAMIFKDSKNPVVEIGLSIASFTYGGLLGAFFLGLFFRKVNETDAIWGFIVSIISMVFVIYFTKIAYTWYVIIGVIVTLIISNASYFYRKLFVKKNVL